MDCRFLLFLLLPAVQGMQSAPGYADLTHPSKVFGEERHFRLFLPPDYSTSKQTYPVIYYFHGHSDRYTLERYDEGKDTVPKIVSFVRTHPAIVVAVDGYVKRDYEGFYGGSPWDIRENGGEYDFGLYFQELVSYIDSHYRTLKTRRYRATSGLSMGGFMSLYLSARFPDLIGSASSFNPGPEFYVGGKGRLSLWRPKDHVKNHTATMVRLIRASGDYISQYHEETRDAYARAEDVDFEYRQDEYHRHWATSIGETFEFHMRAFASERLDQRPAVWHHADAFESFEVWGYAVRSSGAGAALIDLQDVTAGGMRLTTRRYAPDGPPDAQRQITVTTAALYQPSGVYTLVNHPLAGGATARSPLRASAAGKLQFSVDGSGHQITIEGPGLSAAPPVMLPLTSADVPRLPSAVAVGLPVRLYNPRGAALQNVKVTVSSEYPTVAIRQAEVTIPRIEAGAVADVSSSLKVRFTEGGGYFERVRLLVRVSYGDKGEIAKNIDVLAGPENIPPPWEIAILDGRAAKFTVFHQKGNQGGGNAIERTVSEGKGNGNGILEPGEEATVWVRLRQGLDPFDKGNWYRTKVYSDSPFVTEVADIQEQKQREWTSAQERTSVIRLSPSTPPGTKIRLLLDNESWSFHFTPDVRYGAEPLYQAFQFHRHHLHNYEFAAGPGLDVLSGLSEFARIRDMLPDYCHRLACRFLDAREAEVARWQASEVAKRREYVREQTLKSIGGLPERTPLNPRVTGTLDRPDYRIEKIIFESQPGFYVTANLYLPKRGQPPYPAVLYPLGHEEGAKAHIIWQQMLGTLATRGYVALAWDTLGQGERIQFYDPDLRGSKAQQSTLEHTLLGTSTLVAGDALARYTIWDGIRALDYLLSRPEVDPKRVAVTGNSGGGTHTAYLSALDDRFAVAAPSCYITSWRRLLETIGPQDAEQCFPGWLAAGLDHADFLAAFAPKPFLMLSAIRDFFPIAGARETFGESKRVYALAGVPDHVGMVEADDGHGYSEPRRMAAYEWFDRWLKGAGQQEREPVIAIATEEELNATTTGQVVTSLGGETVHSLNKKRADQFHPGAVTPQQIAKRVAFVKPEGALNVRNFGRLEGDGYHIERLVYETEPGITIPALLYLPERAGRKPAVIYAASEGKASAGGEAESLVKAGFVVLSIDARGFGETRTPGDPTDRPWTRYFGDYNSAMTAILAGRTLVGMRAADVVRGVDLLSACDDVDSGKIFAAGRGAAASAVLHAAALDERIRKVGLEGMLVSYRSVVDCKIHYQVFEQVVPGVLENYDLPGLVLSLAPRPVTIVDARDPLGQTVPLDEVQRLYKSPSIRISRRHSNDSAASLFHFEE